MREVIVEYLESIVNDKNISRQGREMLIILKSFDKGGKNEIRITLKDLMNRLDIQNRERVCRTLNELESKRYISIDKSIGRVNKYTFLKEHLISKSSEEILRSSSSKSSEEILRGSVKSSKENLLGYEIRKQENLPSFEVGVDKKHTYYDRRRQENIPGYMRSTEENLPAFSPYNNNINNNYINNNLNDVFINIFKHWNKQNISNILKLDLTVTDSITTALSKYPFETIIKAISNYSEVYYSSYFYDIKWNLNSFLTSTKGIDKFKDNGCMWQNYKESSSDDSSYEGGYYEEDILDKYSYIDA